MKIAKGCGRRSGHNGDGEQGLKQMITKMIMRTAVAMLKRCRKYRNIRLLREK